MGRFVKRKLADGQYEFVEKTSKSISSFSSSQDYKLLVGSIFINDTEPQRKWLDLQLRYLRASTTHFDHVALVSNKSSDYFESQTKVISVSKNKRNSQAHIAGLKQLQAYFREVEENYTYFLFLDSDAFPIRKDWLGILEHRLGEDKDIAIPIRFENLERRLHASVLFCKKQALANLNFGQKNLGPDLVQGVENDVCIGDYQDKFRKLVFPLLRSNQLQVNPLLCGIYYDIFYHHCCGSGRSYNMRGRDYWNHIAPVWTDPKEFTNELMRDPDAFIGNLTQWAGQDKYVKVGTV